MSPTKTKSVPSSAEPAGSRAPVRAGSANGYNGHTPMAPMIPERYESSGGTSERRPYGDGEQLRVELHRKSFSVLWSASVPAADFVHHVAVLVRRPSSGYATVSPADDDGRCRFPEAVSRLEDSSVYVDFIHLDFPDGAFTWRAPSSNGSKNAQKAQGEVGFISTHLRPDWLTNLIDFTATRHIKSDLPNILASAERLTKNFSPRTK